MLVCVGWYVAYPLSLRNLEEMMAGRRIAVDHSTVHRWTIKLPPVLETAFRRCKRPVGKSWRVDETYVKIRVACKYLYRSVDRANEAPVRPDRPLTVGRFFGEAGLPVFAAQTVSCVAPPSEGASARAERFALRRNFGPR